MAALKNPLLETSAVALATTVAVSEHVLFPLFKMAVAMLESFVTSVEVTHEPMPQLQVSSKEYELVEVVQPGEVKEILIARKAG